LAGVLLLSVPAALWIGYRIGRRGVLAEVEAEAARGLARLRLALGADRNDDLRAGGSADPDATMRAAVAEVDRLTGRTGDDAP
jgi:hypothetical protein